MSLKKLLFATTFISIAMTISIAGYLYFVKQKPALAAGNIINATSCEQADVQTAINQAVSGDTVMVPAGSCVWNAGLSIAKGITLNGAGIDKTIITSSGGSKIITYEPADPVLNESFRVSGFTFDGANRSMSGIYIGNNSSSIITNIRIDHNKIQNVYAGSDQGSVIFSGTVYGLIDHNILFNNKVVFAYYGINATSWADPVNLNSSRYMYIEDNTLINNSGGETVLGASGGRFVFRYNTFTGGIPYFNLHGNLASSGISGIHNGGSGVSMLMDSTKSWTINQYATGYYVLTNHTDNSACTITANTSNTVMCTLVGGTNNKWNDNDTYTLAAWNNPSGTVSAQIYENNFTISNPTNLINMRSGTDMVFNNTVNSSRSACNTTIVVREEDGLPSKYGYTYPIKTTPPGYDPVKNTYSWNNNLVYNGITSKMCFYENLPINTFDLLTEQVDYWTDVNNWNMATNYFNTGLSGSRSGTCLNKNVYWETDTRKLYRCDEVNNWVFIYSPYIYPHPLVVVSIPLKGDFNSDSKVNDLDFTSFKNAFKSIFNSIFDLNSDSIIDVKDLGVLMNGWLE